jgi:hypothetical protein
MTVWEKVKAFFGPSLQAWIKATFINLKEILGSPQAIDFYLALIGAAINLSIPEAKVLWNIVLELIHKSEVAHPGSGQGDAKYAMAASAFKEMAPTKADGTPYTEFDFDFALHTALAQVKAAEGKKASVSYTDFLA